MEDTVALKCTFVQQCGCLGRFKAVIFAFLVYPLRKSNSSFALAPFASPSLAPQHRSELRRSRLTSTLRLTRVRKRANLDLTCTSNPHRTYSMPRLAHALGLCASCTERTQQCCCTSGSLDTAPSPFQASECNGSASIDSLKACSASLGPVVKSTVCELTGQRVKYWMV